LPARGELRTLSISAKEIFSLAVPLPAWPLWISNDQLVLRLLAWLRPGHS
jgi:hypothetical protein